MDERSIDELLVKAGLLKPVQPRPLLVADLADSAMDFAELFARRNDLNRSRIEMQRAYDFISGTHYKWSQGHLARLREARERYNHLAQRYVERGLNIVTIPA